MTWNPRKNERGGYNVNETMFSRDMTELLGFSSNGGGDVFHGVNLRDESRSGKKDGVAELICVASDIDFKTTPEAAADAGLAAFPLDPSMVVNSGNGLHVYWLFTSALRATTENVQLVEGISKGIADSLGGDHVQDVSRILRTPGRKNSKYAGRCEVIRFGGPRYDIEALTQFYTEAGSNGAEVNLDDDEELTLPTRFKALLERNGVIGDTWHGRREELKDQSRSGYDMAMANLLVALNFTATEILAVLLHMPSGKNRDGSRRYYEKTIGKAWRNRAEAIPEEEAQRENLVEIMSGIEAEDIEWLWDRRIPKGKLTLFSGDPGVGKSYASLAIAAALSAGNPLPFDETRHDPVKSLIISVEDEPADTLRPRLDKLGANTDLIAIPNRALTVSLKTEFLEEILTEWEASYLVIDPIIAFAAGKNTDKASDVRQLLGPLIHLAEIRNIAIVLIQHLNKNTKNRAIYRGQGSMDFIAACRAAFAFAIKDGRRFMAQSKGSVAGQQRSLEYFIDETGAFSWGDECDETADDILGEFRSGGRAAEKLEAAKAFLIESLANGWESSKTLIKDAETRNISRRTLFTAKGELGIKARRVQGHWWWGLE